MPTRRPLALALLAVAALLLVSVLAMAWLVGTSGGLRFALWVAQKTASASLQIEAVDGRLVGPLRIGRLIVDTADRRITADDIVLEWQPQRLRQRVLHIDRLHIARLEISRRPDDAPSEAPTDLTLPLAVELADLRIAQARFAALPPAGAPAAQPDGGISAISGRLVSDGRRHRLSELHFATARLSGQASLELDGLVPFATTATARLAGEEFGHPFSVTLKAGGTLRALTVSAASQSDALAVQGEANVDLFAAQALLKGSVHATGIDPAAWVSGAPHARLTVQALATPAADGLVGSIDVLNSEPGRLDLDRVPLRRLQAGFRQSGSQLVLPSFTAILTGGGRLSGTAAWADGLLDLSATASRVDASAWHGRLHKTQLGGPLTAQWSTARQSFKTALRDRRFAIELDAARAGERITVRSARLLAAGGSLDLSGTIVRQSDFDFTGTLRRFDPALFISVPSGRLDATLAARGRLGAQPTADLHFALTDSAFAGKPVAGRGDIVLRGDRLQQVDVSLRTGDNRIDAHGRLGSPGDVLNVHIAAPRLEQIGLAGALSGAARLTGDWRAPSADWRIDAPRLALSGIELRSLSSQGHWDPAAASRAELTISRLRLPSQPSAGESFGELADLRLRLDGQRNRHRVHAAAQVAGKHTLDVRASGALAADRSWSGEIEALSARGPAAFHLLAPTRVEAATGQLVVARAAFAGDLWQATLDGLRWTSGRLQSSGNFSGVQAKLFLPAAAPATTLRAGGDWNIDFSERVGGQLRVFRESGDIALKAGDETLALGLENLELAAEFSGRQAELSARASGTRLGSLSGRLAAGLRPENGRWTLARNAPWAGSLRVDVPSIAWLSSLAGENVRIDGRLGAELALGGTPAAPVNTGQVSGSGLRVRLLDYGLDLGGGTLRVDLDGDRARLQRLELISVPTQRPYERRIDFARLTAAPGRLIAEGEIGLPSGAGRIALRAERLTVAQLPDRWLMVSGSGGARFADGRLALSGDLRVDAAAVELAAPDQPTLSSDIVVAGRHGPSRQPPRIGVEIKIDLGENAYFQGAGIRTRLSGAVHLTSDGRQPLRAGGSLRTVGGSFDAYGRELAIERGILNFSGAVNDPFLNVRALRRNLPVEAGVEVSGRLSDATVRLVSEPEVPDSEKLTWLVLGRPPGQSLGGRDADLLLSAAMALRGKQGKAPLQSLLRGLGLEELSISAAGRDSQSRFPSAGVAGSFGPGGTTVNEQIATVGKRIGSNAVLSYERSLASAENVIRLTVDLSRGLSLIGRVGAETALGLFYTFTFGGQPAATPDRPGGAPSSTARGR